MSQSGFCEVYRGYTYTGNEPVTEAKRNAAALPVVRVAPNSITQRELAPALRKETPTFATLRALELAMLSPNMTIFVLGKDAPGDEHAGFFRWDAEADRTANPESDDIVHPNEPGLGVWRRVPLDTTLVLEGLDGVYAQVTHNNTLGWVRSYPGAPWSPNTSGTVLTVTFFAGENQIAARTLAVAFDPATGLLTAPAGVVNGIDAVVGNNNSFALSLTFVEATSGAAVSALLTSISAEQGPPGTNGANGSSVAELFIFRRSATVPATPVGGSYDIATGSLVPPAGWTADVPDGPDPAYASMASVFVTGPSGLVTPGWRAPRRVFANGEEGSAGLSVAELTIFRRSATVPPVPTGGSFNFSTQVLTPPAGWHAAVPAGSEPVYTSRAVVSVQGTSGVAVPASWTNPVLSLKDGEDGEDGSSVDIIFTRSETQPATPPPSMAAVAPWVSEVDALPVNTLPIWSSVGKRSSVEDPFVWQAPIRLSGLDGAPGAPGEPGAPGAPGDPGAPGTPAPVLERRYRRLNQMIPDAPTGNDPAGWTVNLPPGADVLWVIEGYKLNGVLQGSWSVPQRLSGQMVFFELTAPVHTALQDGDLWYDLGNGNRTMVRENGQWVDRTVVITPEMLQPSNGIVRFVSSLPDPATGPALVLLTTNFTLYRNTGSAYIANVAADQIVGLLVAEQIAAGEIKTWHMTANTIEGSVIQANTLNVDRLMATTLSAIRSDTGTLTIGNNGWIRSGNFTPGVSGFEIRYDGRAEFSDIVIRNPEVVLTIGSPSLSPGSSIFATSTLTITASQPVNTTLRYTTDGSEVMATSAIWPGGGLQISNTTTVRVRAFSNAAGSKARSSEILATYIKADTVTSAPSVATPVMDPPNGVFGANLTITTATSGSTIFYRITRNTVVGAWIQYTGQITGLLEGDIIEAYGVKPDFQGSNWAVKLNSDVGGGGGPPL